MKRIMDLAKMRYWQIRIHIYRKGKIVKVLKIHFGRLLPAWHQDATAQWSLSHDSQWVRDNRGDWHRITTRLPPEADIPRTKTPPR